MQLVIPMSGFGERFRRAGYTLPKPLIEVDGRPIIAHVVDMFPGVEDPVFICNREHLDEPAFRMESILRELRPAARIIAIEPHRLGPVHAVLLAAGEIDRKRPVVINYCDFCCYWDFGHFERFVRECGCDGAIPCYTGFHPHMLGSTNYAYVRETDGWVEAIQEKKPYTGNPMAEYASSGTYYFATGAIALDYCQRTVDEGLSLNGEFYASLVYQPMLEDGLAVAVYELQHFMQWGTPEDLAAYRGWSHAFRRLAQDEYRPALQSGTVMMPMAGMGSRFAAEGYRLPKPLIPVSGLPMAVQARRDMPQSARSIFILRRDLDDLSTILDALEAGFPEASIVTLDRPTEGAAVTCLLGIDAADPAAPLTIAACDNGALYDTRRFEALMEDESVDVIVWAIRKYPNAARKPQIYSWLKTEGERVTGVSVKVPLEDPLNDPVVIGAFTFKRAGDFAASATSLVRRGARTGGEFHVDGCIEDAVASGLRCVVFDVDAYICWGTPDELRTFVYWQSCFHKWSAHPYRLEKDRRVPAEAIPGLAKEYAALVPSLPRERH